MHRILLQKHCLLYLMYQSEHARVEGWHTQLAAGGMGFNWRAKKKRGVLARDSTWASKRRLRLFSIPTSACTNGHQNLVDTMDIC